MPESQQHGFVFENDIKTNVFRVTSPSDYTAAHDIDKKDNPFDSNENISIKVTGRTTVDLGDALRVYGYNTTEKNTMVVVKYEQTTDRKALRAVYEIDLNQRELLWGAICENDIRELSSLVKSMPNGSRDSAIDNAIVLKKKELNAKSGVIKFNPKLDSKGQRRLQCSIPKFATCSGIIVSSSTEPLLRGVKIVDSIVSGRRVRNKSPRSSIDSVAQLCL